MNEQEGEMNKRNPSITKIIIYWYISEHKSHGKYGK